MSNKDYKELKKGFEAFKQHCSSQINSLQDRISKLEQKAESRNLSSGESLESFVEKLSPENHQQCATAIGYYYDRKQGEEFTFKDIEQGFLESRWKKYSNMSMLKSKLINEKEWFMESGEDQEGNVVYKLTKEGINFVEVELKK